MHKLTLYYSVSNGGDGSAYTQFCESEAIAEMHQEIQSELQGEGWGESCTGSITLESESPITISEQNAKYLVTKDSLIKSLDYYLKGGYRKSQKVIETAQEILKRIEEEC
jgi:hypothetical protein